MCVFQAELVAKVEKMRQSILEGLNFARPPHPVPFPPPHGMPFYPPNTTFYPPPPMPPPQGRGRGMPGENPDRRARALIARLPRVRNAANACSDPTEARLSVDCVSPDGKCEACRQHNWAVVSDTQLTPPMALGGLC